MTDPARFHLQILPVACRRSGTLHEPTTASEGRMGWGCMGGVVTHSISQANQYYSKIQNHGARRIGIYWDAVERRGVGRGEAGAWRCVWRGVRGMCVARYGGCVGRWQGVGGGAYKHTNKSPHSQRRTCPSRRKPAAALAQQLAPHARPPRALADTHPTPHPCCRSTHAHLPHRQLLKQLHSTSSGPRPLLPPPHCCAAARSAGALRPHGSRTRLRSLHAALAPHRRRRCHHRK